MRPAGQTGGKAQTVPSSIITFRTNQSYNREKITICVIFKNINWGLRPQTPKGRRVAFSRKRCASRKPPGAAAPGPPLGFFKESATDARVQDRGGLVEIEAEQTCVKGIVPAPTHNQHPPTRTGNEARRANRRKGTDSPFLHYNF